MNRDPDTMPFQPFDPPLHSIIDDTELEYHDTTNIELETSRDWFAVTLQLAIIILLAILATLATIAISRLNQEPTININLTPTTQPAPQTRNA